MKSWVLTQTAPHIPVALILYNTTCLKQPPVCSGQKVTITEVVALYENQYGQVALYVLHYQL